DRAKKGFGTFVPVPYEVLFRAVTSRPVELERAVHDLLAPHRNAPNREFFRVSAEVATDSILKMRAEVDGIAKWSARSRILLRSGDRLMLSMRAGQIFALLAYPEMLASSASIVDLWQSHADGDTLEVCTTNSPSHVAGFSDGDPGAEEDPVPFLNRTGTAANGAINGRKRLVPGDRLLWMDGSDEGGACTSVMFEANDYCQIVSRTRSPQFSPEGFPLLLNVCTVEGVPAAMAPAVRQALRLPMPRSWAPRHPDESDGWAAVGNALAPPTHWLPQLADPGHSRKRSRREQKPRRRGTS
ncbi:MAG: GIY-YIG nuclease family protein, partial [Pseudonocardiaceae bacterium]